MKSFEWREEFQRSDGIKRLRVEVNTRSNIGEYLADPPARSSAPEVPGTIWLTLTTVGVRAHVNVP